MATKVKDMCSGNPLSLIFLFSLPLMLGNIFQQLYTVMDSVIVSQTLGVDALAALGCSDWLNWLGFGIVSGFAQGFSIPVAQAFGSHNEKRIKDSISAMLFQCVIVAILIVIFFVPLLGSILHLLNTPATIFDNALMYSRIIFLGLFITMFYNAMAAILRSLGNSKTPLYAMAIAAILNINLDILFVVYFHMGISGAAYATLIAQFVAGLFCAITLLTIKEVRPTYLCKDKFLHIQMYRVGTPIALQSILIAIGGMVLTSVVNNYGTYFIAGFTAINKLYGILEVSAVSYGYAMVTYVGQNYGAQKYERIKQGVRQGMILSIISAIIVGVFLFLFGRNILSIFINANESGYHEVMQVAWNFLSIMAPCLPILYLLYLYRSVLQGLSDTFIPMVSGFLELVFRVGTALIMPMFFAEKGLYPVEVMAWIGAVLILLPTYYKRERNLLNQ